jgi:RNA polymerase sigma-70 factor, ECF subfamily
MHEQDLLLARRLAAGDERAFDEFFDRLFPALFRFALARLHQDADAAEEVVQTTLLQAVGKMGTYRGEASLLTWLCTFCRHAIAAFCERRGRRTAIPLVEDVPEIRAALESLAALADDEPAAVLRRGEIARLVHVVLDRLPQRYADVLEWKYIDGLPVRAIAERLGLSPKAAESLLTRAREAFRDGFTALEAT